MQSKFQQLIGDERPTLIDFSAEWCGPCKMMSPILQDFKSKVGDNVRVIKIDIDRNPTVASSYQVNSVPTLMLFKSGRLLWRQSGVVPTSTLVDVLNTYTK
jgi:thioredoxin 1